MRRRGVQFSLRKKGHSRLAWARYIGLIDTKYTTLDKREKDHLARVEKSAAWVKPYRSMKLEDFRMRPIDTAATPKLALIKEAVHTGHALAWEPGFNSGTPKQNKKKAVDKAEERLRQHS